MKNERGQAAHLLALARGANQSMRAANTKRDKTRTFTVNRYLTPEPGVLSAACAGNQCRNCARLKCGCTCHVTEVYVRRAKPQDTLQDRLPKRTWPLAALVLTYGANGMTADMMATRLNLGVTAVRRYFDALYDATGMSTRRELYEFLDSRRTELWFLFKETVK